MPFVMHLLLVSSRYTFVCSLAALGVRCCILALLWLQRAGASV